MLGGVLTEHSQCPLHAGGRLGGGPRGAAIGEGTNDWKAYFNAFETVGGTEWYIVEHESSKTPLVAIQKCLDGLHALGR